MPDTLASFNVDGIGYIISANEGDGREYIYAKTQQTCIAAGHTWDGDEDGNKFANEIDDCISFSDEARGGDIVDLVDAFHSLKTSLDDNDQLKRIKIVTDKNQYLANDNITIFGGRSFSIWNEQIKLVFDSGDDIAKQVFTIDS
ncbi:MAG: hypothetical protein ACI823_002701 [Chitinophagales bacterium]|jgi:hypothetical protein